MATHSSILAWKSSTDRGGWQAAVHGVAKLDMTLWLTKAEYSTGNQTVNPEIKYIQLLSKVVICLE